MRSHQTFQDENLKQAMMTAAEKANNMQTHVQVIKRNNSSWCYLPFSIITKEKIMKNHFLYRALLS